MSRLATGATGRRADAHGTVALALVAALAGATLAGAVTPPDAGALASASHGASQDPHARRTFAERVLHDLGPLLVSPTDWSGRQWLELGGAAAFVGTARLFDTRLRDAVMAPPGHQNSSRDNALRSFGEAEGLALLAGGWIAGSATDHPGLEGASKDGLEAVILSAGLISPALKYALGRRRPREGVGPSSFQAFGGSASFPSGEATEAFAIASVMTARHEPLWVEAGSWLLAGGVGYARMHADAHWASDIAAGAVLGASVGEWVVHRHAPTIDGKLTRAELFPIVVPRGGGLVVEIAL